VFPEGAEVSPKEMKDAGLIHSLALPTKILGYGTLEKPLTVVADGFSAAAEEKIKAAQGTVRKA
jgi:large subunit ribosomal protein L15